MVGGFCYISGMRNTGRRCHSWVRCETEIIGGLRGGRNGQHLIGGNMRLSSIVSISSFHVELSIFFFFSSFCCYLAIHLWHLGGWPFCSLNFALHVAGTSTCFECSSLLFGPETLHLSGHMSAKLASALGTDCMSKLILHPGIHLLQLVLPRNAVSFVGFFSAWSAQANHFLLPHSNAGK